MTDVQGSTRLWEIAPDAMARAIARQEELIAASVECHGGRLIKRRGEGDSTFSVFPNPSGAALAAIEARQALESESWPSPISLSVRMSVHLGEVESRDDDFYGATLSRCARIREVAHGGQILASGAVWSLVRGIDGVGGKEMGVHALRDLLVPEALVQLDATGDARTFPPLKSLSERRNNLPAQLTSFVGRERLVREVSDGLGTNRLVSLVGPGGAGKTRLALHVAAGLVDRFDAIWFVGLADAASGEEIERRIVEISGPIERAPNGLASHEIIVLDNAEHLQEEVTHWVRVLLENRPNTNILVTSRQRLMLQGERAFQVGALTLPKSDSLSDVAESDSGMLFEGRAGLVDGGFALTKDSAPHVAAICRRLDGIPLAIEQAAALVSMLSPREIATYLERHFEILDRAGVHGDARQRTLDATIDGSMRLLSDDGRHLLEAVSLAEGAFSVDLIAAIIDRMPSVKAQAIDVVRELALKNLVSVVGVEVKRYHIYSMVRDYLARRARPVDEVRVAMIDWAVEALLGKRSIDYDALAADDVNARQALRIAFEVGDARRCELVLSMRRFWMRSGRITEGRRWLEKVIEDQEATRYQHAIAANTLGAFAWKQGDLELATQWFETARTHYGVMLDGLGLAMVTTNLGLVAADRGDFAFALESHIAARRHADGNNDKALACTASMNAAVASLALERYDDAVDFAFESADIARELDDPVLLASVLSVLADAQFLDGLRTESHETRREAIEIWRRYEDPIGVANTLTTVIEDCLEYSRWELAAELLSAKEALAKTYAMNLDAITRRRLDRARSRCEAELDRATLRRVREDGRNRKTFELLNLIERFIEATNFD